MNDAAEYRQNAQICSDCAAASRSPIDREIWRRMRDRWLELALREDRATAA
jgi:hypothetical protein